MTGTIITKKGVQLLVKLLATKGNLNFNRVAIGTGFLPSGYDPASMIDLIEYKKDGVISRCKADNDVAKITMQVSSIGVETGFTMTEIGIFAEDPDLGEILYAYLDLREDPQYVYAEGGDAEKYIEITLEVAIEASTKVTAYINPDSLVTRAEFEEELLKIKTNFGTEDFDDSGEIEGIESFTDFMSSFVKGTSIYRFLANLKAGLKFVLHAGQIVNNCVTDNAGLPLAAAQGKALQDQITQLYSDITAPGDTVFVFDYQNGKYGYNLSPTRGADTFVPFSDEEAFRLALYNAIKPSGFVTANMTHAQMCAALAKIYGVPPLIIKVQITNTSGSNSVNTTTVTVYVNGTVSYSRSYIASQLINGKYVDIEGLIRLSAPHNNTITALRDIKRSSNMNFSSFVKMNTGTSFEWPYNSSEIWYYCAA